MAFQPSERIRQLPPYLFVEIDRKKRAALAAGRDVIDFGVGDPDRPTPSFIVDTLREAAGNTDHHRYPLGIGSLGYRQAIAEFFQQRYGVSLDPAHEIIALIGSKEGLAHLALACVNPGDIVLTPDPAYPVYVSGTIFAGGRPYILPLTEERGWLPDLSAIPSEIAKAARLLFINYPNNPTGAVAPRGFFEDVVAFAKQHDVVVASDAAYNEMYFTGERPQSILEIPGAKDVAIELHSASKSFNMTGWRIGFAAGNRDVLAALARIKANLDSGQFGAIQEAAAAGYAGFERAEVIESRRVLAERCRVMAEGLSGLGFRAPPPRATFYVWAGTPTGYNGVEVVHRLLEESAIVCVPGVGFGKNGEGYVRFAMTVEIDRVKLALSRLRELRW